MNCKVCDNTSANNQSVSFFRFPKETNRCVEWAERCNLLHLLEKHGPLQFYKSFRICSEHFNPTDIGFDGRKKKLLSSAVPVNFPLPKEKIKWKIKTKESKESKEGDESTESQESKDSHEKGFKLKLKLLNNLCRLCAQEDEKLTNVYGKSGKSMNLEQKLKYIPLAVNKHNLLPIRICYKCISKVNQFYDFIIDCKNAEKKLCEILNVDSNKIINPENKKTYRPKLHVFKNNHSLVNSKTDGELQHNLLDSVNKNKDVKKEDNVEASDNNTIKSDLVNPDSGTNKVDYNKSDSSKQDSSNTVVDVQILREPKQEKSQDQFLRSKDQHLNIIPSYSCNICLKTFKNPEMLNSHFKFHSLKLNKNVLFICQICNETFRYGSYLNEHMLFHVDKNCFKCQVCDKKFGQVAYLKHHLDQPHDFSMSKRSKISKISISDQKLNPRLKQHDTHKSCINQKLKTNLISKKINKFGKLEKSWSCQFCETSFKYNQVRLAHEKSHKGERPYFCNACGKTFRSRSSLRQHKFVHSDKRKFPCEECKMSFKRKDTLHNHLRIHTGERPYICSICGFAFKQRGDCIKHEKNHDKLTILDISLLQAEESKYNEKILENRLESTSQTKDEVRNKEKCIPQAFELIPEEFIPVYCVEEIVAG